MGNYEGVNAVKEVNHLLEKGWEILYINPFSLTNESTSKDRFALKESSPELKNTSMTLYVMGNKK